LTLRLIYMYFFLFIQKFCPYPAHNDRAVRLERSDSPNQPLVRSMKLLVLVLHFRNCSRVVLDRILN